MCLELPPYPAVSPAINTAPSTRKAPRHAVDLVLRNLPCLPELPACLRPTERFEVERQLVIEAELALRAAVRQAEMARWGEIEEVVRIAEREISRPFQKLMLANERHMELGGESLLSEEEVEAMIYFADEVTEMRRGRYFPCFDESEIEEIELLQQKYAEAIAETRGLGDGDEGPEDMDYRHVCEHMRLAAAR